MAQSCLKRFWLLCIAVAVVAGCASATPTAEPTHSPELTTYWPTEGWRTSTPEQQGMDSERLSRMMDVIRRQKHRIDSVLVVRNG